MRERVSQIQLFLLYVLSSYLLLRRTPDWFIQGIQSNVAPEDAQSLLLGVYYLLQLPIGVWGWALPDDEDGRLETFRESIYRSSHEHTAISLYLLAEGFGYKMRSDMHRFGYRRLVPFSSSF